VQSSACLGGGGHKERLDLRGAIEHRFSWLAKNLEYSGHQAMAVSKICGGGVGKQKGSRHSVARSRLFVRDHFYKHMSDASFSASDKGIR
jgi:hypothetical protein